MTNAVVGVANEYPLSHSEPRQKLGARCAEQCKQSINGFRVDTPSTGGDLSSMNTQRVICLPNKARPLAHVRQRSQMLANRLYVSASNWSCEGAIYADTSDVLQCRRDQRLQGAKKHVSVYAS